MLARIAALIVALVATLGGAVALAPIASASPIYTGPTFDFNGDEDEGEEDEEGINEVDEDDVDIALTDAYLDMIGDPENDDMLDDPISRALRHMRDQGRE